MSVLESLFPRWAYQRRAWRHMLTQQQRLYEAAKPSDYRPRRGSGASGDAVVQHAGSRLREAARYYEENTDYAVAILDELVNLSIADGVQIEPMVRTNAGEPDAFVNDQVRDLWARFWERPEVSGEYSGPELERLVGRSMWRDGEVFGVHHLARPAPFPTAVPYVLEVLEADFCPFDLVNARANNITHGIQRDAWNRPATYYFYKVHPGAVTVTRGATLGELKPVPAARVLHPKITRRLGQARGVSILAPVLNRIDAIKQGEEYELIAMQVAAALCAVITKDGFPTGTVDSNKNRSFRMRPGMIFDNLLPGEGVEVIDSKRPNTGLVDFLTHQIRRLAAGTTGRYSGIAKDYNGTWSSQRQELVEAKIATRRWLSLLVADFYRPVRRNFLTQAVLAGELRVGPNTDLATLVDAEYRGPAIPSIDMAKEMKGYQIAREQKFMARQQIIRDLGSDPDQVDDLIERDPYQVETTPNATTDDAEAADSGGAPATANAGANSGEEDDRNAA